MTGAPTPQGSNGTDSTAEENQYEKYRSNYEELRDDLMRRDKEVQSDPVALQRWPLERGIFAARVDQALTEWEVFGHKSAIEQKRLPNDSGPSSDRPTDQAT